MASISKEIKVGIMTIISLMLLIAITFYVGKFRFFEKTYIIKAYFSSVGGLTEGSPVLLDGVNVGIVKKINHLADAEIPVELILQINERVKLRRDAKAVITTKGLLGEKCVEISRGSLKESILTPYSSITGVSPVEIQDLITTYKETGEKASRAIQALIEAFSKEGTEEAIINFIFRLDRISYKLDKLLSEGKSDITAITANLKESSEQIKSATASLRQLIASKQSEVDSAISNFAQTAELLRTKSEKIAENIDKLTSQVNKLIAENSESVHTTLTDFRLAAARLKETLNQAQVVFDKISKGEGTVGKMLTEPHLYDASTNALVSIKEAADELREMAHNVSNSWWFRPRKSKKATQKK